MSWTVTLHLWWLGAYLAVGVALWAPLTYRAWNTLASPKPGFWRHTVATARHHGAAGTVGRFLAVAALWPLALWEEFR